MLCAIGGFSAELNTIKDSVPDEDPCAELKNNLGVYGRCVEDPELSTKTCLVFFKDPSADLSTIWSLR